MINEILTAAGVLNNPSRFLRLPDETHAVYFDDIETDGPDGINRIFHHSATIELYEPTPDDTAETAIEAELNARGLRWTKQARYWLKDLQRYQVIYEFDYIEKRRI
jgi:hypothetical protein